MSIDPFANESVSISLSDLTIENRLDRVSIYGNIEITLDREGLVNAEMLKSLLDDILGKMQAKDLPDKIITTETGTTINPFES